MSLERAFIAETLTQIDVCRKIPVSIRTWRRWRARGITPPLVALPGRPRWKRIDVEAFMSGRRWRNSEGRPHELQSAAFGTTPLRRVGSR